MKNSLVSLILTASCVLFFTGPVSAKVLGVVFGAKGKVQYSYDQKSWKKLSRIKRFKKNIYLKTGPKGSCKIRFTGTKLTKVLESNSVIMLSDGDLQVISGRLSDYETESGLLQAIQRKIHQSQSYTSVRIDETDDVSGDMIILLEGIEQPGKGKDDSDD
jgi:hypothetical protein